jgi:hypothetical protein
MVTEVERGPRTVDLHTCYGPALRLLHHDLVAVVVAVAEDRSPPANLDGATRPVRLVA